MAPDDTIRTDTGKLRDFLRGGQEGWTTAYPKWDANSEIMPVPINCLLPRCLQSTHDTVGTFECYTCSVTHEPLYDIPGARMQVPYEEYPLIHTRQSPSWDQFKQRGAAVLRYGDHFQRVRNSSAAEVPTLRSWLCASIAGRHAWVRTCSRHECAGQHVIAMSHAHALRAVPCPQARSLHFKTEGEYRLFGNLAGFWWALCSLRAPSLQCTCGVPFRQHLVVSARLAVVSAGLG